MKWMDTTKKATFFICFLFIGFIATGLSDTLSAQSHTVSGVVISSDTGEALPGVNVILQGTTTGTSTDIDGAFSLTVPTEDDILEFSFVGYETVAVPIEGRSNIEILMTSLAIVGDELVVVGYGAVERRDITGSVSSISARDIQEVPVTNVAQALQGRAAGVYVANSGGNRPGDGATVRIRGRRSLTASNDPLYVVDGIPVSGTITDLNQQDIESIEVLKDASATAIYGSRGANGVILVTTRRGGDFRTLVSYDGYFGVTTELERPRFFNGAEFADLRREANRTIGEWNSPADDSNIFTALELESIQNGRSFNYPDLVTNNYGYQQSHQFSVQGGNPQTQFAISGNFFGEEGYIDGQSFDRYTVRVNLDHQVSDRLSIGTSTLLTQWFQEVGPGPYGGALAQNPLGPPFGEDGNPVFRPTDDGLISNPLSDLVPGKVVDDRTRVRIFSNIFAVYNFSDNLSYRLNFGPDIQSYQRGVFQGTNTGPRGEGVPLARKEQQRLQAYTLENIVNWQQDFENQSLNLTGLFSFQTEKSEGNHLEVTDLPYESQLYHNLGTANNVESFGSGLEEWGIMSFMGRVNYQLHDKYLFTLTGRADGSSRLAPGNQWGFFPSAAVAWRIINEPFLQEQDLFSDLRLRVSYGATGNTAIDPYETKGTLARSNYAFGSQPGFGYRPGQISNPDLQWEISRQVNIGLEFALWNDRVAGSVELYNTNTSDMLLERQLPITSGFGSIVENIGSTRNQGLEVTLSTRNVSSSTGFNWSTDVNFFTNREEIVDLYGGQQDDVGNQWFIGEPLTVWYDYEKTGIWQLDEAEEATSHGQDLGQIKVRDQNGDGQINEQDRIIIGTEMPKFSAGLANHFRYKGVNLSVFLYGSFGQTVRNQFLENGLYARYNSMKLDYWTPENPTNAHPRPNVSAEDPLYSSSRGYMDGSFVKVRNIRLGYDFPPRLAQQLSVQSLRVYVNAETPFVFSKLDNLDPERYDGVIDGTQPNTRTLTFGVNINF